MTTPPSGPGIQGPDRGRPEAALKRARSVRDAGLRRTSRLTGWAAVAALALTVGFSEVAAHALPGRSSRHVAVQQPSSPQDSIPAPQDQGSSGLQPPEQAPQPSEAPGGAVSGGS